MATHTQLHESPLKVPAVEIVDLLSSDESEGDELNARRANAGCEDAWEDISNDGTGDNEFDNVSLYEDALDAMDDDDNDDLKSSGKKTTNDPLRCNWLTHVLVSDSTRVDICTPEESLAYRQRVRLIGQRRFTRETVEAQTITAKKLCTAFGIRLPSFLDGQPDAAYHTLLNLCINRELSRRVKLPDYNTVDDVVSLLKNSENIVVLTGAGVSSSSNYLRVS